MEEALKDYLGNFSYSELKNIKSDDVDKDLEDSLNLMLAVYASVGSLEEFFSIFNTKVNNLAKDKMLEVSVENFRCL